MGTTAAVAAEAVTAEMVETGKLVDILALSPPQYMADAAVAEATAETEETAAKCQALAVLTSWAAIMAAAVVTAQREGTDITIQAKRRIVALAVAEVMVLTVLAGHTTTLPELPLAVVV